VLEKDGPAGMLAEHHDPRSRVRNGA
jgi:hypothetical protein